MAAKKKRSGGKEKIRQANLKTHEFAKKMLGHFIPYEVGMMRALHKRLSAGSCPRLCRNAEIESFHIHARNLMEFFTDDKQCAIDPRTFTTGNYRIQGNFIPRTLENKISQQIVHLTHERTDVEMDKLSDRERDETLQHIEKQIVLFEKALTPEWKSIWQEGLKKMDFDEPKGPPKEVFRYRSGPTGPAKPSTMDIPPNHVAGPTNHVQPTLSEPTRERQKPERGHTPPGR